MLTLLRNRGENKKVLISEVGVLILASDFTCFKKVC